MMEAEDKESASFDFSLQPFHSASPKESIPEVIKNISFSAWNPPPGNRKLRGMMYVCIIYIYICIYIYMCVCVCMCVYAPLVFMLCEEVPVCSCGPRGYWLAP